MGGACGPVPLAALTSSSSMPFRGDREDKTSTQATKTPRRRLSLAQASHPPRVNDTSVTPGQLRSGLGVNLQQRHGCTAGTHGGPR